MDLPVGSLCHVGYDGMGLLGGAGASRESVRGARRVAACPHRGFYARLDREDRTLAEMAGGIALVDQALRLYMTGMEWCLVIDRLLARLVAAIAGLHGSIPIETLVSPLRLQLQDPHGSDE